MENEKTPQPQTGGAESFFQAVLFLQPLFSLYGTEHVQWCSTIE